jgi:hypothetical protein
MRESIVGARCRACRTGGRCNAGFKYAPTRRHCLHAQLIRGIRRSAQCRYIAPGDDGSAIEDDMSCISRSTVFSLVHESHGGGTDELKQSGTSTIPRAPSTYPRFFWPKSASNSSSLRRRIRSDQAFVSRPAAAWISLGKSTYKEEPPRFNTQMSTSSARVR